MDEASVCGIGLVRVETLRTEELFKHSALHAQDASTTSDVHTWTWQQEGTSLVSLRRPFELKALTANDSAFLSQWFRGFAFVLPSVRNLDDGLSLRLT